MKNGKKELMINDKNEHLHSAIEAVLFVDVHFVLQILDIIRAIGPTVFLTFDLSNPGRHVDRR